MFKRLNYDTAAYETASVIPKEFKSLDRESLLQEFNRRIDAEKGKNELQVYYYRIGYTMAFPLPLYDFPRDMPRGIPEMDYYPWSIWLAWEMRERWYILHHAWRYSKDLEAGLLLQKELAALEHWENFNDNPDYAGLCTAHLASCLADFLKNRDGWDPVLYSSAVKASNKILNDSILPWYDKTWKDKIELNQDILNNIPCIILFSSAYLAGVVGSESANLLDDKSKEVFTAWCNYRMGNPPYTEGTAYDGFFLDSMTEWIDNFTQKDELVISAKEAFKNNLGSWLYLTLPGRTDIHAPTGDVEPEMLFWMNVALRFVKWYGWDEAKWLLNHTAAIRLPAYVLAEMLKSPEEPASGRLPEAKCMEFASAAALRTGWSAKDCLVAISYGRIKRGHIHCDNGNILIGHKGRFWITDPGYQQYRAGEERDYTLGAQAHNVPVINGFSQTRRSGKLIELACHPAGYQHAIMDIGPCYENLDSSSAVRRDVWLIPGENPIVAVCDSFSLPAEEMPVSYSWQGGTHLAWAFKEGWGRLSNAECALWIGTSSGPLQPSGLIRHPGSRGPLTLTHTCTINQKNPTVWWVFCFDSGKHWDIPAVRYNIKELKVKENLLSV